METQTIVNKWITDFRKKIDGEDDEDDLVHPSPSSHNQGYHQPQAQPTYGSRRSAEGRRSGDRDRYDADPRVLDDNFTALELRDDEGKHIVEYLFKPWAEVDKHEF